MTVIKIRINDVARAELQAAADKDGLRLATWLRSVALKKARETENE